MKLVTFDTKYSWLWYSNLKGSFLLPCQQAWASLDKRKCWPTGRSTAALPLLDRTPASTACCLRSHSGCPAIDKDASLDSTSHTSACSRRVAPSRASDVNISCIPSGVLGIQITSWLFAVESYAKGGASYLTNPFSRHYSIASEVISIFSRFALMQILTYFKILRFAGPNTLIYFSLPGGRGFSCCCDESAGWKRFLSQVLNSYLGLNLPESFYFSTFLCASLQALKVAGGMSACARDQLQWGEEKSAAAEAQI